MDAMGDLFLLGKPLIGHVEAYKAGHEMHARLGQEILKNAHKYSLISGAEYFSRRKLNDLYLPKPSLSVFQKRKNQSALSG